MLMRSAVAVALVALGIGGFVASGHALAASKLPSYGAAPAADAARELPTAASTAGNTAPRFAGEAIGASLVPAMAGNVGLVDMKAGTSSIEKARTQ
jgi:hypothetical protein